MPALYRAGRQADACAAGRRMRALLAEELEASPGPALRELEAAMLAQDPALDLPARRAPPPLQVAGADDNKRLVRRYPQRGKRPRTIPRKTRARESAQPCRAATHLRSAATALDANPRPATSAP